MPTPAPLAADERPGFDAMVVFDVQVDMATSREPELVVFGSRLIHAPRGSRKMRDLWEWHADAVGRQFAMVNNRERIVKAGFGHDSSLGLARRACCKSSAGDWLGVADAILSSTTNVRSPQRVPGSKLGTIVSSR
jgi:hypothetical protein